MIVRRAVLALSLTLLTPDFSAALGDPCVGDCSGDDEVTIDELVTLVEVALGQWPDSTCPQGDPGSDGVGIDDLLSAVRSALRGCASPTPSASPPPATGTPGETPTTEPDETASATPETSATATPTPSASATATATPSASTTPTATSSPAPTVAPGARRFSLNPETSLVRFVSPSTPGGITVAGFTGFLDLVAGPPETGTGVRRIDVAAASRFLALDLGGDTWLCIEPIVPAPAAGVVACDGGFDLGVRFSQNHVLGVVGEGGFTAADCAAAGGMVEGDTDPHPGTCNGPVVTAPPGERDSGPGAVLIAADDRFDTQGLTARLSIAPGPCEEHGVPEQRVFGLVSDLSTAAITNANATRELSLFHEERGEPFSCEPWTENGGPGRLVLSVPTLHGLGQDDLVTVFVLDD